MEKLLVSDLDKVCQNYVVTDCDKHVLGEKCQKYGFMKPEYNKHGRHNFGRWAQFVDRLYKATPPWLKFEVVDIKCVAHRVYIETRKPADEK